MPGVSRWAVQGWGDEMKPMRSFTNAKGHGFAPLNLANDAKCIGVFGIVANSNKHATNEQVFWTF